MGQLWPFITVVAKSAREQHANRNTYAAQRALTILTWILSVKDHHAHYTNTGAPPISWELTYVFQLTAVCDRLEPAKCFKHDLSWKMWTGILDPAAHGHTTNKRDMKKHLMATNADSRCTRFWMSYLGLCDVTSSLGAVDLGFQISVCTHVYIPL